MSLFLLYSCCDKVFAPRLCEECNVDTLLGDGLQHLISLFFVDHLHIESDDLEAESLLILELDLYLALVGLLEFDSLLNLLVLSSSEGFGEFLFEELLGRDFDPFVF